MLDRVRLCFVLAIAGLALGGCGWLDHLDPLGRIGRDLGVPLTEAGRVTVGGERVAFFRYQKGTQCGTGHAALDSGGAGWGGGPCNNAPISLPSVGASSLPNGNLLVAIDGALNTPAVIRVTVTFADGTELPAEVGGGIYYAAFIAPKGTQGPPAVQRVQGFDSEGKVVEEVSVPGRP